MKKIFLILTLLLSTAFALPLPKNLIAFNSPAGQQLLQESQHKQAFFDLMPYFTTEKGLAFCAVASSVMVLNALPIQKPVAVLHAPYKIFNQTNFFNPPVLTVVTPAQVGFHGLTLDQAASALKAVPVNAERIYASNSSIKQFRAAAIKAVSSDKQFIIINFCRKYINEKGCGHFSPLAAYNQKTDRFLLLDVARYKYLPVWIKTSELFKAMNTGVDSASNKSRGYLLVSENA